jgi:hypothetical protein
LSLIAAEQDLPPITEFQVTALRHGYAYSLEGFTRRAAVGILLLYVLIVIIYVVSVQCFGWSCHGLKSLIEILVLAVTSPPLTEPDDSSSGRIKGSETYKHVVKLREVSEGRFRLVLRDDDELKSPSAVKQSGGAVVEAVDKAEEQEKGTSEVREVQDSD